MPANRSGLALFAKCTTAAVFLLLLLPSLARGQAAPYIWPGLDDYHPGDLAEIFGEGFVPGETVNILFHEDRAIPFHSDLTLTSVANPAGNIFSNEYLLEEHDAGVTYIVTATGQFSGFSAQTTFTDSLPGDCFRSNATTGHWGVAATWQSAPIGGGCTVWTTATLAPTSAASTITIRSGHTITVARHTGGGWINSPANACTYTPACTGITGKANLGFVSKYKKGSPIPEGDTQFHFNAGNFTFDSNAYEWLVISGAKARYRGTGSVNGTAGFGFELTAWDGQQTGGGNVDRFRIKIWQGNPGNVVYGNERGSPDGGDPVTTLGSGSIVIHKK